MIEVDYESIAQKIVNKCMRVKKDEVILVNSGIYNFPLAEALTVNIRKLGAFPMTRVSTDNLERRIITEVPKKYLSKPPMYFVKWLDDVDGSIAIDPTLDPRMLATLPEDRYGLLRKSSKPVNEKMLRKKIRWTGMGYPTKEKADMFALPFEEFWDLFWNAINTDYDQIYPKGKAIAKVLKKGRKVHIYSEKGTDLEFEVTGRKVLVDDGIISPEDIRNNDIGNNLPCGEVFIAPIETSAQGKAIFELAFYRGNRITDIEADYRDGKVVRFNAAQNEKLLRDVIANSQGAKDVIGEFGIGLNPEVTKAIGYTILDEKLIGSIHIAVGENRMMGGKNESTLHWDMVMLSPTVEIDGKTMMDAGKLKF